MQIPGPWHRAQVTCCVMLKQAGHCMTHCPECTALLHVAESSAAATSDGRVDMTCRAEVRPLPISNIMILEYVIRGLLTQDQQ